MAFLTNYRCLVVDDEQHAIDLLREYIQSIPQLTLAKTFQDPVEALLETAPEVGYDFVFLDIDMPRLSGLDLARSLRSKTTFLIFTTAHAKYAAEAFDVRADHFLLKPFGMTKFALAIHHLLKEKETAPPVGPDSSFYIRSSQRNKLIKICPEDIISVEGLKNYVRINTCHAQYVAYLTLKEIEHLLSSTRGFIRVHKSFIIAEKYIERIDGRTIRLRGNQQVPIGETYKKYFYDYLQRKVIFSNR